MHHWCLRRRVVSMLGVCATTSLLSFLYFHYSPLSSLPYSPQPLGGSRGGNLRHPSGNLSESRESRPPHDIYHLMEPEDSVGTVRHSTDVTAITNRDRPYTMYNNYDSEENVYDHYASKVNNNNNRTSSKRSNSSSSNNYDNRLLGQSQDGLRFVPDGSDGVPRLPRFVKEKMDVLSVRGDDSDYLFPACEDDATFQPNDTFGFVGPFRYLANYKNPCWMEPGSGEAPTVYCVPYFYLVGAPKAGSTDVYKRITMHPEVAKPVSKETRWFDRKRFLDKPHFSSFLSNFERASGVISRSLDRGTNYHRRIVGDGSPSYFFDNRNWQLMPGNEGCEEPRVTVASHLRHLYPKARLIFILRNPVERLYSSYLYNHGKYEAVTSRTFDLYAREAIQVYKDCFSRFSVRVCANNATIFQQAKVMLVVSLYSVFVQDWMKLFPRDQLMFISTEKYNENMPKYLGKLFNFLGLWPVTPDEMRTMTDHSPYNRGQHYSRTGPMLNKTRRLLEDFFRPFNRQLANMLNNPEFLWMG
ncbi:hypothetical protein ACOMHN_053590 [Nucella lapillus]